MTDINEGWQGFRQRLSLARHYAVPYQLMLRGVAPKNPVLEQILPSLLIINAAAILDDALVHHLERAGVTLSGKYHNSFGGRLRYMADVGMLADADAADALRKRRNRLAHTLTTPADWAELDAAVETVERELVHLRVADPAPSYEFFAEKSKAHESDVAGGLFAWTYRYGLRAEETVVVEITTKKHVMRDSAGGVA